MRRGEIWLVALEPTVGAEIGKTRPAVIVSDETVGIFYLKLLFPSRTGNSDTPREIGWFD